MPFTKLIGDMFVLWDHDLNYSRVENFEKTSMMKLLWLSCFPCSCALLLQSGLMYSIRNGKTNDTLFCVKLIVVPFPHPEV